MDKAAPFDGRDPQYWFRQWEKAKAERDAARQLARRYRDAAYQYNVQFRGWEQCDLMAEELEKYSWLMEE